MTRLVFGFPVLDPLPFVENDQVPRRLLDGEDVAEHLLVVADVKKQSLAYWPPAIGAGAADELHVAVAEAVDFAPPLRLERRRADDEHLADLGLAGQQLGRRRRPGSSCPGPCRRPARPGRRRRRRRCRRAGTAAAALLSSDLRSGWLAGSRRISAIDVAHPLLKQPLLDELLGVGIDRDFVAELLQL